MVAVKAKKPVSKKLKAGKKKKTNKWLILGGVAAVAIIGAVVVRFSSASTWTSLTWGDKKTRVGQPLVSNIVNLKSGGLYRFCVRGHSSGSSSKMRIGLQVTEPGRDFGTARGAAGSTKAYGRADALHCSKEFRASKNYVGRGIMYPDYGSYDLYAVKWSLDQLR